MTDAELTTGRTQADAAELEVAGARLVADASGALWWPLERVLVVADLHLEKGSSFAARGQMLPPYDTAATLARLARAVAQFAPRAVIALGDSFHDRRGQARMAPADLAALAAMQAGRDWLWIAGNHDPEPVTGLAGVSLPEVALGPLTFRHEPQAGAAAGEVSGHLHPVARLRVRGHGLRRRCLAADAARAVLPAFGAYAGGLNMRDPAFAPLFPGGRACAWVMGAARVYRIAAERLLPDPR